MKRLPDDSEALALVERIKQNRREAKFLEAAAKAHDPECKAIWLAKIKESRDEKNKESTRRRPPG
jgi:hypothetical protein